MRLLALSGQRSAALAQYETCRRLLADELGIAPAAATVQMYEQIKAGGMSRGAGEQGGRGDNLPPHNLPPQITPFVGREPELVQLQMLLAQPDVHLITILGAGGMGKTRLALALAEQELTSGKGGSATHLYEHGVYFASLARLATADLLPSAIAEAINFHFKEVEDQREQLLRYLSNKAILLVLDNFEHLLAGTNLVDEILQRSPQTKLLITSRVRLNRQSEQLFPVVGMTYPSLNGASEDSSLDLTQFSAVQLFLQRARRVRPDFVLTADIQPYILKICHLLQGMPLGIVLAASWLESLSPRAISQEMEGNLDFLATEMGDVPQRQRSLRAAFNHSWQLLSPREQAIFSQMSIFRGGFSRAAAQVITEAMVRDLQALVNKSLLTLSPDRRYDVHELLRQFAAEKLRDGVELETAVHERHSIYYCALLQQHTPNWHNAHQLDTLAEVTREASNIQVAWAWALHHEAWQRLSEAIDSWGWYHQWRGLRENGEGFCLVICTSLEQWSTTKPANGTAGYHLWAKAMIWYGVFATAFGVTAQRIQQSLTLLTHPELAEVDTRASEVFALFRLGSCATEYNRQEARSYLEKSLLLYRALQDPWGIAASLSGLGSVDWAQGDYVSAEQRMEASLAIYQKQGDQWDEAGLVVNMGWLYQNMGQPDKTEQLWQRALDLFQQLNYRYRFADVLVSIVVGRVWQGRFEEGMSWAQKSIPVCQEMGYLDIEGFAYMALGSLQMFTGNYEQARQMLARALALQRAVDNHAKEAFTHCALGCVALGEGEFSQAQRDFEESLRLYRVVQGDPHDPYAFLALNGLGILKCHHGELDQSRHYFIKILTEGLKRKDFLWVLTALSGISLYWLKRGKLEQAFIIWAQALCHPHIANSQYYEDVVGQVVREATADLPPHIIEAAQANGRSQDIWIMAESLLGTLQAET
jgi:predicted ATPase/Tfp pilus assembly protein PilF